MKVRSYLTPIKLTRLALLVFLATIFQLAAKIIPGFGHFLSMLSSLPIIVAARLGPVPGGIAYVTSGLLIFFLNPAAAPVFWLATGLLGLILGLGYYYQWSNLELILYSGLLLSAGIYLLGTIFKLPILGGIAAKAGPIIKFSLILPFALGYTAFWRLVFPIIRKIYELLINSNSFII